MLEEHDFTAVKLGLRHISMLNIPLCLVTISLNSLVLIHYLSDRTKLTSKLFILIAAADIWTALGHLGVAITCCTSAIMDEGFDSSRSFNMAITGVAVAHEFLGLMGYAFSIFLNTLLAVVRTIKICDPFYELNTNILYTFMIVYLVWFCFLGVSDTMWSIANGYNILWYPAWMKIWDSVVVSYLGAHLNAFVSYFIIQNVGPFSSYTFIPSILICVTIFVVPIFVVVGCLTVQLYVRGSQSNEASSINDWGYVNRTVSLLSVTFVVCNCGIVISMVLLKKYKDFINGDFAINQEHLIVQVIIQFDFNFYYSNHCNGERC